MALVAVDEGFPGSLRAALKMARALMAFVTFLCFLASGSRGAYTALAGMETLITALFFLVYLLQLDRKLRWPFWPVADIFNSVIAALFLLVVCLAAVIIKSNKGTLAGGVLGFILLCLCLADMVVVYRRMSFAKARETNTPAKYEHRCT